MTGFTYNLLRCVLPSTTITVMDFLKVENSPKPRFYLSVGNTKETIELSMVTTANELPGFKIVRSCGFARGITVRSRNLVATIIGALCSLGGGRNHLFTELCEQSRDEALQLLIQQAIKLGGNAIVGCRYESHDVLDGVTEVLAYGTAVSVEINDERQP